MLNTVDVLYCKLVKSSVCCGKGFRKRSKKVSGNVYGTKNGTRFFYVRQTYKQYCGTELRKKVDKSPAKHSSKVRKESENRMYFCLANNNDHFEHIIR